MASGVVMAILAGGASRRMGRDKAGLVLPSGESVLERTVRLARPFGPVLVVGRAEPAGWSVPGVTFLPDDDPLAGPAAGLATALRYAVEAEADADAVLALSCDLPLLDRDALLWIRNTLAATAISRAGTEWHGVIAQTGDQWQPLFAAYRPLPCLPLLTANLARGERSLKALLRAGTFAYADAPPAVAAAIANVNTPEDWARITPRLQAQAATDISAGAGSTVSQTDPSPSTETG
jgi:molybdenum cofactor guanylyltransferase